MICPLVIFVSCFITSAPMLPQDWATIAHSEKVCQERYGPKGNPCLAILLKTAPQSYRAICGAAQDYEQIRKGVVRPPAKAASEICKKYGSK
jgi:hypothetical protein